MKIGPAATCARCGKPAEGYAGINGKRYCHGDTDERTCYELANYDAAMRAVGESDWLVEFVRPGEGGA